MRLAIVFLLTWVAIADAAPRVVRGVVTQQGSSRPIVGAIAYTDLGALATTDNDGYFTLDADPTDRTFTITAPGYEARTVVIADDLMHVELVLASATEVIEVVGKAPEQTKPLSYELTSDEIRLLPGAGNDVLRAAQVLPGVARIPFSFGGLVLRGTSPRDTAVYLDGIEVPISFHFGGVTSFYPSEALADLSLVAGGFDVSYGRAQGGLVTLTTREPRTDRWRVGGSIGLLDSGVMAEGPLATGGITIGVRRSYFDTIARPFVDADVPLPSYWDAQVRASFGDPACRGRITPMLFLSIDRVASDASGNDGRSVSITSMFVRAAMPYLRTWGKLSLHVVPWLGTNRLSFADNDNFDHTTESFERPVYPAGVRADVTRDYPWGHLRGGLDGQGGYLSHSQIGFSGGGDGPQQSNGTTTIGWADLALWGEARYRLAGDRVSIKPGVRVDAYGLTGEVVVDARVNITQKLTDQLTLRQAIGRFHQPPTPGDVDPRDGNRSLDSSYMDQISLGVDAALAPDTTASLTGFFNYGHHLGVRERNPSRPGDDFEPNLGGLGPTFELLLEKQLGFALYRDDIGRARSAGLELLAKRARGRWFGLVAYTLSIAQRTDNPALTQTGPYPYLWRPFELDQRHNFNAAGSVMLAHWRLGARVQLVSGNPYSPGYRSGNEVLQRAWTATLPMFFQLDVRADRRWHRCWGDVNLYIDIQNLTNRRNIEGREWSDALGADKDTPGLPIVPFIGVEFLPR